MKSFSEHLVKFFSWASCGRRRWFPWVFIRRREFDLMAALTRRAEADEIMGQLLARIEDKERTIRDTLEALSLTQRELEHHQLLFSKLCIVVPRLSGAKAQGLTLFIPRPVLDSLKKAGSVVVLEFARELGRRMVLRALKELFDNPSESTNLPK